MVNCISPENSDSAVTTHWQMACKLVTGGGRWAIIGTP